MPTFPDPHILGLDVYHGDDQVQFHAVASAGIDFVLLKASQGVLSSDPAYADYRLRAVQCGLAIGAYHFFSPDNPVAQVHHFLNAASPKAGDIIPSLDIETWMPGIADKVRAACEEVKSELGRYPICYMDLSYYQSYFADGGVPGPLWLARYGVDKPGIECQIWQYSASGTIDGIEGTYDLDVFYGDATALDALKLC